MKKSVSLLLALIISMGSIALIAMAQTSKVSAQPYKLVEAFPGPLIYIFTNYSGPLVNSTVKTIQVRLSTESGMGAPHVTNEPAIDTDKTYAYEILISFDPTILQITTDPIRHASRDWFNTFHKWTFDWDFYEWMDDGPYSTAFAASVDNANGRVSAWCSLIGDPATTTPLPEDDMGERSFPNAWLHGGDYYDLPYSDGIDTASLTGGWSGNYFVMFYFRYTTIVEIPETGVGSWLHIEEARLWCLDAKTLYPPGDTWDGYVGEPPAPPEFPLGAEYALGIALATAVAYVVLTKRRRLQVVP